MILGFDKLGLDFNQANELMNRMSEPHRYYHTVTHVADIIISCEDDPLMIAAAWGHDIIYDPASKTNEIESAEFMVKFLANSEISIDLNLLHDIIVDTAKHEPRTGESQLFSDMDMGILASIGDRYRWYRAAIRKEYAFVPWDTFSKVRAEILEGFDKKQIYFTENFRVFEKIAHLNLQQEISDLREMNEETYMGNFL